MLRYIATMNEIVVKPGATDHDVLQTVLNRCVQDQEVCLDVVDTLLQFRGDSSSGAQGGEELSLVLTIGRSVWDTAPDGKSLVRRTDVTASDQARAAMTPNDVASAELSHAWDKVFGRHQDASDAWDHAIKATEAVLIPIVCPKKDKANLGSVAGYLTSAPHVWKFALGDGDAAYRKSPGLLIESPHPGGGVSVVVGGCRWWWRGGSRCGCGVGVVGRSRRRG